MRTFIDTNVPVYWVDDSARADAVEQLLAGESVISVQVLNEFANVLRKKRAMPVAEIRTLSNTLKRSGCAQIMTLPYGICCAAHSVDISTSHLCTASTEICPAWVALSRGRIMISTSWLSAVRNSIKRSTEN